MERYLLNMNEKKGPVEETVIPSTFFNGQRGWMIGHWKFVRISFIHFDRNEFDELWNSYQADQIPRDSGSESPVSTAPEAAVWSYEKGTKKERPHVHILGMYVDKFIDYIKSKYDGFKGNANFSIGRSVWESQKQFEYTIQYIVKDGDYNQFIFEKDWIDRIANRSFKKTQHGKFNEELEKIRINYIENKYGDEHCIYLVLKLKSEFNQSINQRHVMDRIVSWKCYKSDEYAKALAENWCRGYSL